MSINELASSHPENLTLDQQVCFALAVATRNVISLYRPLLEPLGLTHPQYLVMVAMWQQEPMSVTEISRVLQLEPPSVSPVLKRLQSAGWIKRQRDALDERTVRLTLTEEGRALKQQVSSIPAAIADRLAMSPDEVATLHATLTGLIERTHAAQGQDHPATN
ncbi:MAG TPA: MarR family transcriptional regulator [Propionibacteriaceae bacterium]